MDEDRRRREYILNIILVGSIVMLAMLDGIVLAYSIKEGSHYQGISFMGFSILPAFFVFLYILSRRGYSTIASYFLITTYAISNSYAAYRWGVTLQVVVLMYALIIIIAGILRGTKFGFFLTGVIAMFIIPLWYLQFHGVLHTERIHLRVADAIIFSVMYFLIMIVAWLYDREIERSLHRARVSEYELKNERDLLEINIKKRTDELRKAQFEKVDQLKRFAELGQLSSGLFHDIFNLLNAIALRQDENLDPSIESAFKTTRQIENFMQAVRRQIDTRDNAPELFSLTQSINHGIQLVNYKAQREHISIVFERISHDDITYLNAPFKFHQVIINLLLNGIEAYERVPRDDKQKRVITITLNIIKNTNTVFLEIKDNACGMPPEISEKIFEPFFTTKEKGRGIGIGLAMVKKIIEEDFLGTISVTSVLNEGSTFTITFPLHNNETIQKHFKSSP